MPAYINEPPACDLARYGVLAYLSKEKREEILSGTPEAIENEINRQYRRTREREYKRLYRSKVRKR